jgi:hypothetical protein
MRTVFLIWPALLPLSIAGCVARKVEQAGVAMDEQVKALVEQAINSKTDAAVGALAAVGAYTSIIGAALIPLGFICLFARSVFGFPPARAAGACIGLGITLLVSGAIMGYMESWIKPLALVTLFVGVAATALVVWRKRTAIEAHLGIDLDRDGHIGVAHAH